MNNITPREQQAREIKSHKSKQILVLTGKDQKKATVFTSALVSMANNPNLMNCSVDSILNVGFEIVQAGLNPNPLFGQAYVVPFKGSAQLQIGYKGWIALGYRHGWRFKAVPVYKCDDFKLEFGGFEDIIHLEPNYDERDESAGEWVRETVSIDAAYGGERIIIHLDVPTNATPPFQPCIYFPGRNAVEQSYFKEAYWEE